MKYQFQLLLKLVYYDVYIVNTGFVKCIAGKCCRDVNLVGIYLPNSGFIFCLVKGFYMHKLI